MRGHYRRAPAATEVTTMLAESMTVRECEGCETTGLSVERSTIDGEKQDLCPECSREAALGRDS